ncbi:MAG: hypothetical protein QN209_09015, partial [Armatimonadota bacterium]|nr:hypothetical protein [Armatimonadota bacterium]
MAHALTHRVARPLTYRRAGVDVAGKSRLLEALGPLVARTLGSDISPWGGFAGVLRLPGGADRLALTVDGVGTKT